MINYILSWSFLSKKTFQQPLKLTHMSLTDMRLWSDERNEDLSYPQVCTEKSVAGLAGSVWPYGDGELVSSRSRSCNYGCEYSQLEIVSGLEQFPKADTVLAFAVPPRVPAWCSTQYPHS